MGVLSNRKKNKKVQCLWVYGPLVNLMRLQYHVIVQSTVTQCTQMKFYEVPLYTGGQWPPLVKSLFFFWGQKSLWWEVKAGGAQSHCNCTASNSMKHKNDLLYAVQYMEEVTSVIYPARARSARARGACALRALGLLLADGTPTVGGGKTFWRVSRIFLRKQL